MYFHWHLDQATWQIKLTRSPLPSNTKKYWVEWKDNKNKEKYVTWVLKKREEILFLIFSFWKHHGFLVVTVAKNENEMKMML